MLQPSSRRFRSSLTVAATLLLCAGAARAQNTATGTSALGHITTGTNNSAFGAFALNWDGTGSSNTAVGYDALAAGTTPASNTAVGFQALECNSGSNNTAVGTSAMANMCSGSGNIAIGQNSGSQYSNSSNNIVIGNVGVRGESGVIRIGSAAQTATYIAGISGVTSSGGTAVYVNSSGQLGTLPSSLRFKQDVQDMGDATEGLMQLRPVTFYYKPQYDDGSRLQQYGLIAEEVAKVYPGLVQYDKEGRPAAVRYQFLNAMLLNEVQSQHRQLADQQAQIEELQRQVKALLQHQPAK